MSKLHDLHLEAIEENREEEFCERLMDLSPEIISLLKDVHEDHVLMFSHHQDMCSLCARIQSVIARAGGLP